MESRFFEPPRDTKIGSKNRRVREIEGKITVFDWGEGNDFWFELSGGSKNWESNKEQLYNYHFFSVWDESERTEYFDNIDRLISST